MSDFKETVYEIKALQTSKNTIQFPTRTSLRNEGLLESVNKSYRYYQEKDLDQVCRTQLRLRT